ncbi:MAG: ECF transporter S component, partial [Candidatus Bathyarchaeia archaeon]
MDARKVALISIFSALQVILSRLPGIPVIGLTSGRIEPTILLMPVIGMLLGPWIGGLAVFLGNFIAWLIPSTTFFGLLMLPTGPIGAVASGALVSRDNRSGWKITASILLALILLWYISIPGFIVPYYPSLHLAALILVLVLRGRVAEPLDISDKSRMALGAFV